MRRFTNWFSAFYSKPSNDACLVRTDRDNIQLNKSLETMQQIEELFADNSFPSLVILDGAWGSGKTFFTKEVLIPKYEEDGETLYLSVLGTSSINDFTNRLLGALIKNKAGDKFSLVESVESLFGGVDKNANQLGWVGTIGSGFSDILKGILLNRLAGLRIVVDDIERLENKKLIHEIIGECYQLAETKDIKFLFLTDRTKLEINDKQFEKFFSGCVSYSMSTEETFHIVFSARIKFDYAVRVKELLNHYNIKNIRVLKRLHRRISNIEKEVKRIDYANVEATMHLAVEEAFAIVWLSYIHQKDTSKIASLLKFSTLLLRDDEPEEDRKLKLNVSGLIYPSNDLIQYIVGNSHYIDDIGSMIRIIRNECPIDRFLFSVFNDLDESEFDDGLHALRVYIFEEDAVSMQKWFECCEVYKLLIEWEYVDDDVNGFLSRVEDEVESKKFSVEKDRTRTYRVNEKRLLDLIDQVQLRITEKSQKEWVDEVIANLGDWLKVENYIRNDQLEPKLHLIPADNWAQAMRKWSPLHCVEFAGFLQDRYRGQLLQTHFQQEKIILLEIRALAEEQIEHQPFGLKRGALIRLNLMLNDLLKSDEDDA